jgi:hypothetical protein
MFALKLLLKKDDINSKITQIPMLQHFLEKIELTISQPLSAPNTFYIQAVH